MYSNKDHTACGHQNDCSPRLGLPFSFCCPSGTIEEKGHQAPSGQQYLSDVDLDPLTLFPLCSSLTITEAFIHRSAYFLGHYCLFVHKGSLKSIDLMHVEMLAA